MPVLLDPDRKMCRVAAPPERDFTTNAVVSGSLADQPTLPLFGGSSSWPSVVGRLSAGPYLVRSIDIASASTFERSTLRPLVEVSERYLE